MLRFDGNEYNVLPYLILANLQVQGVGCVNQCSIFSCMHNVLLFHTLRVVDFVNDTVKTLAGNGNKGSDYSGGRQGTNQV